MHHLLHRILTIAGYALTLIGALLLFAWAIRGARPALECGLLDAAQALDWPNAYACLDKADYDPLIGFVTLAAGLLAWLASRLTSDSQSNEYNPSPEERTRNRNALATRVQRTWIDGVLDKSLYQALLIALGWTPSPASVAVRPWSLKAGRPDEAGTLVSPDQGMAALFDQSDNALLILGDPGSGKTTMLLDLTRALLARRTADGVVPMVFNLASWTGKVQEKEQPFDAWLMGELRRFYAVPEITARYLVEHNELALILDGLDEVRSDLRNGCVAAINAYREQHIASVALCCRKDEYAALTTKLVAHLAVTLQPLTDEQRNDYLAKLAIPQAEKLKTALAADDALREVASSPLMLSVMLGAGDYLRVDQGETTPAALRTAIYDAYLHNMLSRERETRTHFPSAQVVRQLSWLAGKMVERSQAVFLLERLNVDWFNRRGQELFGRLIWGLIRGLIWWLIGGLMYGLIGGLSVGLIFGLIWGLIFGLIVGLIGHDIDIRENVDIEFSPRKFLVGLIFGLIFGLIGGLILGLIWGMIWGLIWGMIVGLIFGLIFGLITKSTALDEQHVNAKPNSAVIQLLRNCLLVGVLAGVLAVTIVWVLRGQLASFDLRLSLLSIGLTFLFVGAWLSGIDEVIGHYALRIVLWLDGSMPLRYVRFLDYCAERILLRKVGGGYIFIHRTFMQHMAQIDPARFADRHHK
jgi:hypothetical protein